MAKFNVSTAENNNPTPAPVNADIAAGPPTPEAGGLLTVDLGALVANWQLLSHHCVPAECAAVVKADAYGCGIEPVAAALARAGCKTFFVADLSEARRLRPVAPDATIYVLNGLMPDTAPVYAELRARPVIGSMLELSEWDAFCTGQQWRGGAALHVDTGMNRLGVTPEEAAAMASRIRTENHGITLVMSHLACADQPDHPLNARQMALFREIRMLYRGVPSSLANSSGIFLNDAAHCDVVRPGVALYGVNPTPGFANPMRPVVELKARIAQVRLVKRGETVGYNASWTTRRATRLATVAVGYGDGYMWASGSSDEAPGGAAIVGGKRCPIAGRISMDLITVDITDLPEGTVRRGEMATLIGGDLTVDDVARAAGTIGYELLTALGRRYHRDYLSA
ncbi:MAG: alanine racemase [Rhodopseudomonas sp.]|nr:alanine racemase [Rhodopseudomonas sp.]